MKSKLKKFISILLIIVVFYQIFLVPTYADSVNSMKGFVRSAMYIEDVKSDILFVLGDNMQEYVLITKNITNITDVKKIVGKRIIFSGNTTEVPFGMYSSLKGYIFIQSSYLQEVTTNSDYSITAFTGEGDITTLLGSTTSTKSWNYTNKDNNNYQIIFYSSFSQVESYDTLDFKNSKAKIEGYKYASSNKILLTKITKLGSTSGGTGDTPEIPIQYNTIGVFDMEIKNFMGEQGNTKIYRANMQNGSFSNTDIRLIFDKENLKEKYPLDLLENKKLKVNIKYNTIVNNGITLMYVTDWSFMPPTSSNILNVNGKIVGVKQQNSEIVVYEIESDNSSVTTLRFTKSKLASKFPKDLLVGRYISAYGKTIESNSQILEVDEWITALGDLVSVPSEEENNEEQIYIYSYYGTLEKIIKKEIKNNNPTDVQKIDFLFRDFEGREYIMLFDKKERSDIPYINWEGRKVLIEGVPKGYMDKTPIVQAVKWEVKDENFTHYENEVVALTGQITEKVKENGNRITYSFETADRTYIAIFDKEILENTYPNGDLLNKKLQIFGLTYYDYPKDYVGVMSYRDIEHTNNYGKNDKTPNDGLNSEIIDVTPIKIVSQTENEILYYSVSNNGDGHFLLFSKDILKNSMPSQVLIGKEITASTLYIDTQITESTTFVVNGWTEKDSNSFKVDRGIFTTRVEHFNSASVYTFKSVTNREYEVLVADLLIKELANNNKKLEEMNVTLYGYEKEWEGRRLFVLYGINENSNEYINEKDGKSIVFTGIIKEIVSKDNGQTTYYLSNQYNQFALAKFSIDILKQNYPTTNIVGKTIALQGHITENGTIIVSSFNYIIIPKVYPNEIKSKYDNKEYYPNLKGFTGMLSVLSVDEPHIVLITSSDTYILEANKDTMKKIEKSLGKFVYLRGEPSEVGVPYWTGKIDVYDISPLKANGVNLVIKPKNKPVPDIIRDPFKKAVNTEQLPSEQPKDYPYGIGIFESLYFVPIEDININDNIYKIENPSK